MEETIKEKAQEIVNTLQKHGFQAYWAGGCVRDLVMETEPQDYDIATAASPDQVQSIFPRTIPVGAQFGVVLVLLDDIQFQVATFRGEQQSSDDPLTSDASLRDFTINGLFYDPLRERILDFVGGKQDIHRKIIRAIGNPYFRFKEDKLRPMRGVRLAVRYNFTIEENTYRAMQEVSSDILQVSTERVRDELVRILTEGQPALGMRLLLETGILHHILPEIVAMKGVEQPPQYHPEGDVFTHTLLALQKMRSPSVELAMGTLLHDVGKPRVYAENNRITFNSHDKVGAEIAFQVCQRLRFSRKETERIISLVKDHLKFIQVQRMRPNKLKRFLGQVGFEEHLELHRLDCIASHDNLENWDFCCHKLEELSAGEVRPPRLINGHDLIGRGYTPGPIFGKILSLVEDAQFDEKIFTQKGALQLAEELLSSEGIFPNTPLGEKIWKTEEKS